MIAIIKFKKPISLVVLLSIIFQLGFPLHNYAITGGPSMPEYRSFEPVATTNMVNMFDGSFTYNIPLLDVPNGYPLNLSYHSNEVNNEAQASWVGLGWTLNPGAINRNKRGFPDEYNGASVTYHNRMQSNWTVAGGAGLGAELFGNQGLVNLGLNASIRYNNYNGVGTSVNAGLGIAGVVSMDFSYAQGRFGFNPEINPAALFSQIIKKNKDKKNHKPEDKTEETKQLIELGNKRLFGSESEKKEAVKSLNKIKGSGGHTQSNQISFGVGGFGFSAGNGGIGSPIGPNSPISFPTTSPKYNGFMADIKVDVGVNFLPAPIDPEIKLNGSFSIQKNVEQQTKYAYGYMNNESGDDNAEFMMDYFSENDSPFEKRDNILGYPLPNNDIYSVSGEGTNGAFRPFRSEFGTYRPDRSYSDDIMINVGLDFNLPSFLLIPPLLNFTQTTGVEVGGSYHWLDIGDWDPSKLTSQDDYFKFIPKADVANSSNENWFFRYSGDLGGNYDVVGNDAAYKVGLDPKVVRAELDYSGWSSLNGITNSYVHTRDNKRRSSYIGFNNATDVNATIQGIKYKAYEKSLNIFTETQPVGTAHPRGLYTASTYSYTAVANSSAIQEMASTNADGVTYIYGLPVYTRNEKQLSYSLRDQDFSAANLASNGYQYIPGTDIANSNLDNSAKRKLGYESNTEYATTHLLTQICSPDYIDRLMDGPTEDDFGSYTKINYVRYYGGTGTWFPYRSPYSGLNFGYGSLSSNKDDAGSFSYGEKEIYFIRSVESKTHVAIFTLTDREDGASADLSSSPTAKDLIKGYSTGSNKKSLKKLSKIELYSKNDVTIENGDYIPKDGATPIKTVRFDYTYDLCDGIPNNTASNGKLTLKKVWFEYEGKLTKKISPYEFYYEYPNTSGISNPVTYPSHYSSLSANANLSAAEQNPNYSVVNTDRWGNYRSFSQLSSLGNLSYVWPYVAQKNDYDAFDPAAHQLKRIILPSRGEIHIQYEENDYMYVQDKKANVMAPLLAHPTTNKDENSGAVNDKKYYIDVDKLGINWSTVIANSGGQSVTDELFEPMRVNKDRMYFNFLYSLIGTAPDITNKKSEYVDGYARIQGYGYDSNGPFFVFKGTPSSYTYYHAISYSSNVSQREVPRKVCTDFYNTQRRGMINGESNSLDAAAEGGTTAKGLFEGFVSLLQSLTTLNCCAEFRPDYSYVRLQFPSYKVGKKGGGVRVKRLLMYDAGIESNTDVLYGNEYTYTTKVGTKVISSGVATNEPEIGRKENSLVKIIDKDYQSGFNAILYGRDMYSQEGPLGESLLPSASVGYSKVTVNNIHKGKTSTGSEVHEFYTCKDYPFVATKTTIEKEKNVPINIGFSAGGFSMSYYHHTPYLSQGYSFVSNGMHGQPKRIAKYANGVTTTPMAEEMYEYYTQTEQVKVMDENLYISTVPIGYLGKEAEILSERRQVTDVAISASVGADITVGGGILLIPPVFPAIPAVYSTEFSGGAGVNEKIMHTHVTSKIISYPAIVKKVTNISDGLKNITENLVIDKFTGKPVVTRTYDEYENNNYNSNYLTQNFMAGYSYPNMRPKSINERKRSTAIFKNTSGYYLDYTVTLTGGGTTCNSYEMNKFIEGDFVEVTFGTDKAVFHISNVDYANNKVVLLSSGINTYNSGVVPSGLANQNCNIEILRSGYTNQLNAQTGSVVFNLNDPSQANFTGVTSGNNLLNPVNSSFLSNLNAALVYAINHPSTGGIGYGQGNPNNPVVPIPQNLCGELCPDYNTSCPSPYTSTSSPNTIYDFGLEILNYNTSSNPYQHPLRAYVINLSTGQIISGTDCIRIPIKFGLGWHEIFYFDATGYLATGMPGCTTSNVSSCFKLCPDTAPALNKVITATAANYSNQWAYSSSSYPILKSGYIGFTGNTYETGETGKWRPYSNFVYRSKLNPNSEAYTFDKGSFTLSNSPSSKIYFDWLLNATNSSKWVQTGKSNSFHPNGNSIEDENILGVKSTAKFGYNYSLPVLIAQNAPNDGVAFESFETRYNYTGSGGAGDYFEDDIKDNSTAGTWSSAVAHTGLYSVNLVGGNDYKVASLTLASSAQWNNVWDVQQGLQVRVWVYMDPVYGDVSSYDIFSRFNTTDVEMKLISSCGKWHLYEATYKNSAITSGSLDISIRSVGTNNIFIDDVRVQPLKSEMVCYVYDKAHRLIATLDDQHFASLFEYNSEGALVRKLKETTLGIKTISETQYNSKGVNR
jgi:YD repeat-containing protein